MYFDFYEVGAASYNAKFYEFLTTESTNCLNIDLHKTSGDTLVYCLD